MASDFPSDLIRDIQMGLRHAAGIPSYDPSDPSLPPAPVLEEAVHALDPSIPDYLRCRGCRGGLCRGINSTLCIFCGAEQHVEGVSRTISFLSTAGCRRFLQSLDLDGSEIVNFEDESKDSIKGQDLPTGGITLSNILDFELIWPRHAEESDSSSSTKVPSQVSHASLSEINLDNFFSDQKKNGVSSWPSSSCTEDNATASSAHNVTSEKVMPKEHDVDPHFNLFSSSEKFSSLEGGQSLDAVNSSPDAKGGDLGDAFADWETDFQSASSVTFEDRPKPIDTFQSYADFQSANSTAVTVDPIQIDVFQNALNFQSHNPTDHTIESRAIDLFQTPAGFQSKNFEAVAGEPVFIDLSQKLSESHSTGSRMIEADSLHYDSIKKSGTEKLDQSRNIGYNNSKNWSKDDMSSTKILKEADQLENISWTSVGEVINEKEETPVRVNCIQDDNNLIDDWQYFTSVNALDNFTEAKSESIEDLDFGSFVQSESTSAALNDLQTLNNIKRSETGGSAANRMNSSNEKTGNSLTDTGLDVGKDNLDASKCDLDMLLAQMPDLSFMLDESLCIPKKLDSSDPNS